MGNFDAKMKEDSPAGPQKKRKSKQKGDPAKTKKVTVKRGKDGKFSKKPA